MSDVNCEAPFNNVQSSAELKFVGRFTKFLNKMVDVDEEVLPVDAIGLRFSVAAVIVALPGILEILKTMYPRFVWSKAALPT